MRRLWQWFCGYICVCITGRQINRFLNLCAKNRIYLWKITYDVEHNLRAFLRFRDFYNLKPYLRKTKTKIRILSKKGFPFWCYRHPKLKWFFCFCFLFLCLVFYSFNFLWNIEIKGNSKVSTEEILECLEEHEIEVGLKRHTIDCSYIELILREQFQELGWVTVYLKDTRLCIEVKESLYDVMEPFQIEENKSYHLISNRDGKISSIITRAGKAVVKEGQFVKSGDILVLGQNEIYADNGEIKEILSLKADASVYAEIYYDIKISVSEMEILALKIAGKYDESLLLGMGYQKLNQIIEYMPNTEVLNKSLTIVEGEKNIYYQAKLYVREQIGIIKPAEELRENEFE